MRRSASRYFIDRKCFCNMTPHADMPSTNCVHFDDADSHHHRIGVSPGSNAFRSDQEIDCVPNGDLSCDLEIFAESHRNVTGRCFCARPPQMSIFANDKPKNPVNQVSIAVMSTSPLLIYGC